MLDLQLLQTFALVADSGSMTRAATRLGRTQASVSLQISRLEAQLGGPLFTRAPRGVRLTDKGELLLPQARRLLRLSDEILAGLSDEGLEGEVRLGAPEDFATTHLPEILAAFSKAHPRVALQVTCELTMGLLEMIRDGRLDLALVKREPMGPDLGVRVWREPLVWVAASPDQIAPDQPAPLVVAPSPCVYRRRAIRALEQARRSWRVTYTSPSLAGQHAALRAGLGLSVLPREMAPRDLVTLGPDSGLPALEDTEIALMKAPGSLSRAAERLGQYVLEALDRERGRH